MTKAPAITFFLLIATSLCNYAQYNCPQNKVWAFGYGGGLDFTSGSPVPFASAISTAEGCASVSDASGHLLFYTDGKKVYNRTGAIMPSGGSIVVFPTGSTSQAAVVAPVFGDTNRYYIFSLEGNFITTNSNHLAYSVIDLSLAGGMGDVVPGATGIPLDSLLSEKLTSVAGDGCNTWVIGRKKSTREFVAYNVSITGISTPVISSFPTEPGYVDFVGCMVVSPDRRKIAVQSQLGTAYTTDLYDFDPATGLVSNRRVLDSGRYYYGIEFSPDNTKLYSQVDNYYTTGGGATIEQFDLSLASLSAIVGSRTVVATGGINADTHLRLGPDGKIYSNRLSDLSSGYLDVINYPNLAGGACGYASHAITLSPGTNGFLGLPACYIAPGFGTAAVTFGYTHHDTLVCIPAGDSITIYPHDTASAYLWYDGRTTSYHWVSTYGVYRVQEESGCLSITDSVDVVHRSDTITSWRDTVVCVRAETDSILLYAPAASNYQWYDGDTANVHSIRSSGIYWVRYMAGCVFATDTFNVTMVYYPAAITGPDSVCAGDFVTFSNSSGSGLWSCSDTTIAQVGATSGLIAGLRPGVATVSYGAECKVTKVITVVDTPCLMTGVVERNLPISTISIYNVPAKNEVTLSCIPPVAGYVIITNNTGHELLSQPLTGTDTKLDISFFSPGVYYVECRFMQTRKVLKLVKL